MGISCHGVPYLLTKNSGINNRRSSNVAISRVNPMGTVDLMTICVPQVLGSHRRNAAFNRGGIKFTGCYLIIGGVAMITRSAAKKLASLNNCAVRFKGSVAKNLVISSS